MKIRRFIPKQKLRAATARRAQPRVEDFAEPNMSFAKALVVVVVLHIVAVGGIYAFNSIKAHKIAQTDSTARLVAHASATPAETRAVTAPRTAVQHDQETRPALKPPVKTVAETTKPAETAHRKIAEEPARSPAKEMQAPSKDQGIVYTVAKGDNPVAIAKKFHVSYNDLLKANKIDNPKQLQIGQKLHIPAKSKN